MIIIANSRRPMLSFPYFFSKINRFYFTSFYLLILNNFNFLGLFFILFSPFSLFSYLYISQCWVFCVTVIYIKMKSILIIVCFISDFHYFFKITYFRNLIILCMICLWLHFGAQFPYSISFFYNVGLYIDHVTFVPLFITKMHKSPRKIY